MLTRYGYLDEAYLLLNREEYPSWLYPVKQGATTIWERWDSQKPDGSFADSSMNSFNHYAYGAIGEWMYRVMAGIETDESAPGYKHVLIQPRPGGGFTARERQPRDDVREGELRLDARRRPASTLAVEVPVNTRATVRLPGAKLAERDRGRPGARRRAESRGQTAGWRRRSRGGGLRPVLVRLSHWQVIA